MNEVGLIVLGAVLAMATSVVMEFVRQSVTQRRIRALLTSLLRDEIESITGFLERLAEDITRFGYIPFQRLTDIAAARQGFDRNRDWIVLYKDESIRRQLFKFYQEVGRVGGNAWTLENLKAKPEVTSAAGWVAYYDDGKKNIVIDASNLSSRGQNLVTSLKAVKK